MAQVSVIGLGLMGSALAWALHRAGHEVVVWNRSGARAAPFAAAGVAVAESVAAAVAASPVTVICIEGYDRARGVLEPVAAQLTGRLLVQLSTGTPKEAQVLRDWVVAQGGRYLDGAILCGPEHIGQGEGGEVLVSGDTAAWAASGEMLACLAHVVRFVGDNVGAAAVLDLAWLMTWYGKMVSGAHAARMCVAEGLGLDDLIALMPGDPFLQSCLRVIRDGSYDDFTASLQIWGEALSRVQAQAQDAGIPSAVPDFFASCFKRAVGAGFGQQHVMALYKAL